MLCTRWSAQYVCPGKWCSLTSWRWIGSAWALGCGEVDKTTSTTIQHVSSELEHGNFEDLSDTIWLPTRMYKISPISTAFLKGCLKFGISTIQYRAHLPQLALKDTIGWKLPGLSLVLLAAAGRPIHTLQFLDHPPRKRLVASAQAFPAIKTDRESKCRHLNSRWTWNVHQITLHLWHEVAAFEEMRTMRKLQPFSVDPGLLSQSVLTLSSLPAFNHLDCQTMEKRLKHMNWKERKHNAYKTKLLSINFQNVFGIKILRNSSHLKACCQVRLVLHLCKYHNPQGVCTWQSYVDHPGRRTTKSKSDLLLPTEYLNVVNCKVNSMIILWNSSRNYSNRICKRRSQWLSLTLKDHSTLLLVLLFAGTINGCLCVIVAVCGNVRAGSMRGSKLI